jgi:branched-chain amino acid transport system ATP-binding protein
MTFAMALPPSAIDDGVAPDARAARVGGVILALEGISLAFGGVKALADISFDVREHEIRAIIGPNGAGKSSMLNVINGVYHPQHGTITYRGVRRDEMSPHAAAASGIARTFQNIALFKGMSVLDNIMTGRNLRMRASFLEQALWWGRARREELEHRAKVEEIIDFLEIQHIRRTPVGRLPYGLQKRVELARCLAMEPRVMLLDEPVAGMDSGERAAITDLIERAHSERDLTVVIVEHDMGMVMRVAQRILVLDFGKPIATGTASEIQRDPRVIRASLGEEPAAA